MIVDMVSWIWWIHIAAEQVKSVPCTISLWHALYIFWTSFYKSGQAERGKANSLWLADSSLFCAIEVANTICIYEFVNDMGLIGIKRYQFGRVYYEVGIILADYLQTSYSIHFMVVVVITVGYHLFGLGIE